MRCYKYQLFNFLLDLKTAFTKLAHIRVHEFPSFLYIGRVSNAFEQKQNFGSSFEYFSTKKKFGKVSNVFHKIRISSIKYLRSLFSHSLNG